MAYVIEIDNTGYYLRDTSTGLRTQYPTRDHLLYAAGTIAVRSWDRVLEGLTRLEQLHDRPARDPQTTEVEP
ncbi:hypothetical protein BE20_25020 [Sorangium cellulosum]|uniref:Uncharacterized protein n=1 Tax=Sorangium cellulosum TaxID=56 RepID=A0A150SA68_SORCE|nr:hypothetical protein BE20_25020 [Sorangium cellulosum]KYF89256.1 hypothetical protein BE18_22750 [Sorangium cellulosum]